MHNLAYSFLSPTVFRLICEIERLHKQLDKAEAVQVCMLCVWHILHCIAPHLCVCFSDFLMQIQLETTHDKEALAMQHQEALVELTRTCESDVGALQLMT